MEISSYVGKLCYWTDKVTSNKKYDGIELGVCLEESTTREGGTRVYFEKPFQGFCWQDKSYVRLTKEPKEEAASMTTEDNNEEVLDDAPVPDNQRGDDQDTDTGNGSFLPLDRNPLDIELENTKMDYLKALSVYQKVQAIAWQDAFNILTFLNRGPDKDPEVDKIEKKVYELFQASMGRWRHTETTLREMKRFRIST